MSKNFIFLTLQNHLWTVSNLDYCFKRIVKEYNDNEVIQANDEKREYDLLPRITAHTLRHSGCTRMAEMGMDARTLQKFMGHENLNVTMKVYNHVDTLRLKNEIDRLDIIREKTA